VRRGWILGCCGLTKYGRRELIISTVAFVIVVAALGWLSRAVCPWAITLGVIPLAVWVWVLWFFRDPRRQGPDDPAMLVSPADGRVSDITPVGPDSPLGRDGLRVGVFMSVFSVHVNRSPAEAVVESVEHRDGAFLDARNPAASERNESATIRMTHVYGGVEYPIVVRQVAGLVARRIVTDLTQGRKLARGERIGMVKFGSRLELLVPRALVGEVCVQVGDRVLAGQTALIAPPPGDEQ